MLRSRLRSAAGPEMRNSATPVTVPRDWTIEGPPAEGSLRLFNLANVYQRFRFFLCSSVASFSDHAISCAIFRRGVPVAQIGPI